MSQGNEAAACSPVYRIALPDNAAFNFANPDRTFAANAGGYIVKTLEIHVLGNTQTVPEPASTGALGVALLAAGVSRRRQA